MKTMSYSAYPTQADVDQYIAGLPNISLGTYDTNGDVLAAIAEWERLTEYKPFLSTGQSSSRIYDPPGPFTQRPVRGGSHTLILRAGLISCSSVIIGVGGAETTLVNGTDYWLWPANASDYGKPYTAIEFSSAQWGMPRSIRVTGVWGFAATIPDDAWAAVRDMAVSRALHGYRDGLSGGWIEIRDDDVSKRKSIELLGSIGDNIAKRGADVLLRYRLVC